MDLVFYNHLLKCFVLFDLKSGEVAHQDFGHTDMYVRMMNELKRAPDDNPTVGIILCNYRDSSNRSDTRASNRIEQTVLRGPGEGARRHSERQYRNRIAAIRSI